MGIGAAIGSAVIGASSAKSAQKSQERAAAAQLAVQERMYDETTDRFAPFYDAGLDYQNVLRYELLGGDRPTFGGDPMDVVEFTESIPSSKPQAPNDDPFYYRGRNRDIYNHGPTTQTRYRVGDQVFNDRDAADEYARANPTGGHEYQGFQATPGYQFALDQGINAIDASAAARGGVFSGATTKSQQRFGTGLANQEYGNYLNRLTGQASAGQAAAGNMANAGQNFATGASNAYANMGNAGAAGAIGMGNALTGGINNAMGLWNYQNMQSPGQNSFFGGGKLFGGNSWG